MVLIFLVFCVVVFGGGSVVLIFLIFCVVVFRGVSGAHLFSFLCCGICFVCLRSVSCVQYCHICVCIVHSRLP